METSSNADLPVDVIRNTLWRLPVKALMRFKCVCKNWRTLIESSTFVNQHFSHKSNPDCLLIQHYKAEEDHLTYTLYADAIGFGYQEPDYLQMQPHERLYLMGPLRGVFCVVSKKSGHLALINPALRQFRPIPSHDLIDNKECDYVAGFGFDPLSEDYTVISIPRFSDAKVDRVCIYNSGSDSWRHIENVDLATKIDSFRVQQSTCLDGVHYWISYTEDDDAAFILALDSSDNFQEIQVPDCIKYKGAFNLDVYGDSIALLSFGWPSTDQCIDVWVMKEVGHWTRICTLGPIEGLICPSCFWKTTELVLEMEDATSVTLCNVSTGILRTIKVSGSKSFSFSNMIRPYKESLVSINNERGSCKLWDPFSRFVEDWFDQK